MVEFAPVGKKIVEANREDQDAQIMPRPKLPEEVVDIVVELLLCGWTPQDVIAGWPRSNHNCGNDGHSCPALVSIQRIAREHGLAHPRGGGKPGRKSPGSGRGGGAPKGHAPYLGAGRPRGPGKKFSRNRDEARRLRSEGLSHQAIAGIIGISRQQVANLLSDG